MEYGLEYLGINASDKQRLPRDIPQSVLVTARDETTSLDRDLGVKTSDK